ncbi:hypothetical protein FRC08_007358 [Ceratobasidium sp. 394]|nr:hypothetical protein FRC08_007358 [Ceratobasidium sp. 394]
MGNLPSILEQTFPPAPRWSVDQIPDLAGQIMIVTGGNSGIGYETCKALLAKNAKVYMAARCPKKANAAIAQLKEATNGKSPIFLQLDLADLQSVRAAATQFTRQETELHCLFNNGGVCSPPLSALTIEGYDLQFGTNVLGHYLLTTLLLPTMIHTARTSPHAGGIARVINVSSILHLFAPTGGINYASLEPHSEAAKKVRKSLGRAKLYSQSKWGLIALSNELARRYASEGIVSIALHPGNVRTGIQRHIPLVGVLAALADIFQWDASYGALTQLYAGTTIQGAELNGKYFVPWVRRDSPRSDTEDILACQMLWKWLELQVERSE